ncbi:hypothetical protein [Nocardioides sp. R-C-SC26]|uniref:hypothetical protein n=1 Tax=Nocardioides sp. R-C-SC26 TaxID=2870414 RepID=UPI001E582B49|nr:hypothetical protein [Nocardioides sp. R-C-SC26]
MGHPWSDDEIARLPVGSARAELLEEIMNSTDSADRSGRRADVEADATSRRATRWLVPLAAAAVVAALATAPVWWPDGDGGRDGEVAATPPSPSAPTGVAYRAVLVDASGWTLNGVADDADGGEIDYERGQESLEVHWREAGDYTGYVEDRSDIGPATDTELAGLPALQWSYDARDHTTIRDVQDGFFLEVRGSGMDLGSYTELLGQLRMATAEEFQASLPEEYVTDAERADVVAEMLQGIADAAAPNPVRPTPADGSEPAPITSTEVERYNLGADVAGTVACEWIAAYESARESGTSETLSQAQQVLSTSRQWPVLQEMAGEGDYPRVIWQISRRAQTGQPIGEYAQGVC